MTDRNAKCKKTMDFTAGTVTFAPTDGLDPIVVDLETFAPSVVEEFAVLGINHFIGDSYASKTDYPDGAATRARIESVVAAIIADKTTRTRSDAIAREAFIAAMEGEYGADKSADVYDSLGADRRAEVAKYPTVKKAAATIRAYRAAVLADAADAPDLGNLFESLDTMPDKTKE